jgi:LuxR family transcriptional regulator, quorum-sensing system regulator SdiA
VKDECVGVTTVTRRIGELVELLRDAGPAGFAIGLHLTYLSPRYMFHAYPSKWQETYARKGYVTLDPTVHWGLANDGWIDWSDLRSNDPDRIFDQAAAHGMPHGLSVAISGRGSRSIASFARADRAISASEAAVLHDRVSELHDLTFSIHALPASLHDLLRRLSILLTQG